MIRYFSYIDVNTIDSLYNQLDNSYDLKKVNKLKKKEFGSEIKTTVKNIILGFLDAEGKMCGTYQSCSSEEIEKCNTIETKIIELLKKASGSESKKILIDSFNNDRSLICGKIMVMECNYLLHEISSMLNIKLDSYLNLLEYLSVNNNVLWNELFINSGSRELNGIDILKILDNWSLKDGEGELFSFVVIDNKYPIIMDMSYKKITMPHSDFRSSGFFASSKEFCVLGITNKINNIYSLKPLALWNIMDLER